MREIARREALKAVGTGSLIGIAGIGSASNSNPSPEDLDTDFDPYEINEVAEFVRDFFQLSESGRKKSRKNLVMSKLKRL